MMRRFVFSRDDFRLDIRLEQRRGAMLVMICVLLIILLAMALFTVDVAYMQLTRSELRAATDAAAKAGAEALRRTQSGSDAKQAAIAIAAKNTVGGKSLNLREQDIELGRTTLQLDGSWKFQAHAKPYTAVQVNSEMGGASANSPVQLFFAGVFGAGTFEPVRSSTASSTEAEIVLAIDRSHSMTFDLSGVDWSYPPGVPSFPLSLLKAPAKGSRWASLMHAIHTFEKIAHKQQPTPRLALVSWASDIMPGSFEAMLTGLTMPAVLVDSPLSLDWGQAQSALMWKSTNPMLGATNLSAGLDQAVELLQGADVKPLASKIILLMTDGQWNQGRNPVLAAEDAKAAGCIVHTVTFLPGAEQSVMEQVAEITGGRHYHADNEAELIAAFEEIARLLPVVLTE